MKAGYLVFIAMIFFLIGFVFSEAIAGNEPGEYTLQINPETLHSGCIEYIDKNNPLIPDVDEGAGCYYHENPKKYQLRVEIPRIDANLSDKGKIKLEFVSNCAYPGMTKDIIVNGYNVNDYLFTQTMSIEEGETIDVSIEGGCFAYSSIEKCMLSGVAFCLFFPDLSIELNSTLPSHVTDKDEFYVEGYVSNPSQIDANDVTLRFISKDFKVEPDRFTFDVKGNYDAIESRKQFKFKLTPIQRDFENKELNGIYFGTLNLTFVDDTGITRTESIDLGKASFSVVEEEQNTTMTDTEESNQPTHYPANLSTEEPEGIPFVPIIILLVAIGILGAIYYLKNSKASGK